MRYLILLMCLPALAPANPRENARLAFEELDAMRMKPPARRGSAHTPPAEPKLAPQTKTSVIRPRPPERVPTTEPAEALDEALDFAAIDHARMDRAIREETNRVRERHGLRPLDPNPALAKAARIHARRMSASQFFSHTDPEDPRYRTPTDRALAAGVTNPKIAENIALRAAIQHDQQDGGVFVRDLEQGHFSRTKNGPLIPPHTYRSFAAAIVQQWMDSPGHRRNILAAEAVEIGCAVDFVVHKHFPSLNAVQVFQWFEPALVR